MVSFKNNLRIIIIILNEMVTILGYEEENLYKTGQLIQILFVLPIPAKKGR